MGIVAILYFAVLWQWRVLIGIGIVYGLLTVIGSIPITLSLGGTEWIGDLQHNMISSQRFDLACCFNLYPVLMLLLPERIATALPLLLWLIIPLLAIRFRPGRAAPDEDASLAVMTLCGLVTLLAIYSRPYNLVLLLPAVVLMLRHVAGKNWNVGGGRAYVLALAASLAVFLQPIPPLGVAAILQNFSAGSSAPVQLLWTVLTPIQTYALLALAALLIWRLWCEPRPAEASLLQNLKLPA